MRKRFAAVEAYAARAEFDEFTERLRIWCAPSRWPSGYDGRSKCTPGIFSSPVIRRLPSYSQTRNAIDIPKGRKPPIPMSFLKCINYGQRIDSKK